MKQTNEERGKEKKVINANEPSDFFLFSCKYIKKDYFKENDNKRKPKNIKNY